MPIKLNSLSPKIVAPTVAQHNKVYGLALPAGANPPSRVARVGS